MPQVAQFTLPQPGQQQQQPTTQLPAGAPAVAQFPLPPSAQQQAPDSSQVASQFNQSLPLGTKILQGQSVGPQQASDTAAGVLKGIGSTAQSADVLDTMNRMAGQPTLPQRLGVTDPNVFQPSNPTQRAASTGTQSLALATPIPEVSGAIDASRLAAVPKAAKAIAAPKATVGTVAKGLMSLGENPQSARDAKAIESLVANGVLKVGDDAKTTANNVGALKDEITKSATNLVSSLKGMDVQPTVQPEELTGIFKKQLASIEKNVPPTGQAAAKTTAQWIWQKFINNLPKGKDITAEDLLAARKATDSEVEGIKGQNVFDPATENGFSTALRAYRQGANDLLEKKAPGSKAALSYQSSLYNVLENVAKKGAPAVKKAEEIVNTPGIKGLIARHPVKAAAVGAAGGALLEGAGLAGAAKLFGVYPSSQ